VTDLTNGGVFVSDDGRRFLIEPGGPVATQFVGDHDDCRNQGIHYHCTSCGAVTSMCGHTKADGTVTCQVVA